MYNYSFPLVRRLYINGLEQSPDIPENARLEFKEYNFSISCLYFIWMLNFLKFKSKDLEGLIK